MTSKDNAKQIKTHFQKKNSILLEELLSGWINRQVDRQVGKQVGKYVGRYKGR